MHVNAGDQRVRLLWGLSNVTTFFLTYYHGITQNIVGFLVIFVDILENTWTSSKSADLFARMDSCRTRRGSFGNITVVFLLTDIHSINKQANQQTNQPNNLGIHEVPDTCLKRKCCPRTLLLIVLPCSACPCRLCLIFLCYTSSLGLFWPTNQPS